MKVCYAPQPSGAQSRGFRDKRCVTLKAVSSRVSHLKSATSSQPPRVSRLKSAASNWSCVACQSSAASPSHARLTRSATPEVPTYQAHGGTFITHTSTPYLCRHCSDTITSMKDFHLSQLARTLHDELITHTVCVEQYTIYNALHTATSSVEVI